MYENILFIGTGQIGKAILNQIVLYKPKKIIIHNLTKSESDNVVNKYSKIYKDIEFINSYGNIFMPYSIRNIDNRHLYDKSDEIIDYFYNAIDSNSLEKSTIVTLIKKYKPDLIIDAINTATVLGNAYNPEYNMNCYLDNSSECCKKLMVDDYTTKIINFVYSLKYGIETYKVKKYIKVSTTGLGGMGINMPYTHGDNPKYQLSSALMGKIAASGVLHQMLWNLSHIKTIDVSLIIPGTFVGYDSVISEPVETDNGLLMKRKDIKPYNVYDVKELKYNNSISNEYLEFPVVRAGENHVYSSLELEVLTAIGQMEAITKEEVANKVLVCLYGSSTNDVLKCLDSAMLQPTYAGRKMIDDINKKFKSFNITNGIATGNLGVTLSKQLYELYLLKLNYSTIDSLKNTKITDIVNSVNSNINKDLIDEIVSLGIPILLNDGNIYISDYTLIPTTNEKKDINDKNIDYWCNIGWVDLRKDNIKRWCDILINIYNCSIEDSKLMDLCIDRDFKEITNDYNISEYLAYYYNKQNRGRRK